MAQEIYFTHDIMKPKDVKNNSRKRDYQEANLEQLDILNLVKGKCWEHLGSGPQRLWIIATFLYSQVLKISINGVLGSHCPYLRPFVLQSPRYSRSIIDSWVYISAHESKIGRLDELDTVQDNMSKIAEEHASTLAKISDLTVRTCFIRTVFHSKLQTKVSSMDNKHKTTSKSVKQLTETTSNIQGEITDVSAQLETTKGTLC